LLAEEKGVPFLGKIPLEPLISARADTGRLYEVELPILAPLLEQLKQSMEKNRDPIQLVSLIDQKHLKIVWADGQPSCFDAHALQESCPCARCKVSKKVKTDVLLREFARVGRYGLRFDFSSGCSSGIYPFDLLKRLAHVF
jgi:DUF971 family protein